ncbi:Rz1 family lipoprotein [Escherichia coli]|uniref:Rz1 family lipoprotein n=1 Tax=Escherichia coli TaxID=562 RepID=UPI00388DCD20
MKPPAPPAWIMQPAPNWQTPLHGIISPSERAADDDAEATGRGAGIYPYSVPEISFVDAPYRRCIPSLTETAARQGDSSARVCGDNQKRYTPGFTALTERGVVPS